MDKVLAWFEAWRGAIKQSEGLRESRVGTMGVYISDYFVANLLKYFRRNP